MISKVLLHAFKSYKHYRLFDDGYEGKCACVCWQSENGETAAMKEKRRITGNRSAVDVVYISHKCIIAKAFGCVHWKMIKMQDLAYRNQTYKENVNVIWR